MGVETVKGAPDTRDVPNGQIAPLRGSPPLLPQRQDTTVDSIARGFHSLLQQIGEDPDRDGLRKTPERAAKAMLFFTSGYDQDIRSEFRYLICSGYSFHMSVAGLVEFVWAEEKAERWTRLVRALVLI